MKILLWIAAALVAGALLFGAAVALLFNASSFREMLSADVNRATQRQLAIGEIHVGLFPTPGARINNLSLSNATGFGDGPMAQAASAQIGVRIMPLLLHRHIEISSVALEGLRINLVKRADGKGNWEDLGPQPQAPGQPPPVPQQHGHSRFKGISGVDIEGAAIAYTDQRTQKSYVLSKLSFSTGAIAPDQPFDFKLAFSTTLADPALNAEVQAAATLDPDAAGQAFDAQNLQASAILTGAGVPGGKQALKLGGNLHYDRGQGLLKLSGGKLALGGVSAALTLDGSGLGGDAAHYTGSLDVAPFNPREALKTLGLAAPNTADSTVLQQASLSATLDAGKNNVRLDGLRIKLDQSTFSGSAALAGSSEPPIQFALKLDQIDADRYLAPAKRNPLTPRPGSKPGEGDNAPLALDRLDGLSAAGTLEIGKLKLKNLHLAEVRLKLAAARGAAKTLLLDADLYGGTLAAATRIGPGALPDLAQTLKLDRINAGPLLQDLTGKNDISGVGNLTLDVTSAGNSVNQLKRGLNGRASFALRDGAVKGFNLGKVIRRAQTFSGEQAEQPGEPQQTDFISMNASGIFHYGVFSSDDLNAASPLLRLTGAGQVDVAGNTIDYTAKPALVNTASGQDGKDIAQLQGIVIPVHIYGPLDAPKYKIDLGFLRHEAEQKLEQKIQHQGGELGKALRGLFGHKHQDQQDQQDQQNQRNQPSPQNQPDQQTAPAQ